MSSILDLSLDDLLSILNIGAVEKASANNLYGINYQDVPAAVPSNKDRYGLTFFVRPQLNLQTYNVRAVRKFYSLLSKNPTSIQTFVRTTLDPRLQRTLVYPNIEGQDQTPSQPIQCPLTDPYQAFIPVLTNNLLSISGWPDLTVPTFTSSPGLYEEVYSQADGHTNLYGSYDLDVSFRNTLGDPIILMFYIWCHYQYMVFEGRMTPYTDFIIENEIDYMTRIYRIVLDNSRQHVTKIAATGVAFPIGVNISSFFDYNRDQPFNTQSNEIRVRFRCLGAEYLDDVLIDEFNKTVEIFNPSMEDGKRDKLMVRVPEEERVYFNHRGYMRIDPDTYRLDYYVTKDEYDARIAVVNDIQRSLGNQVQE